MAESEQAKRKIIFDQTIANLAGKTQDEKWAYFDAHPGTQEIFWEFRNTTTTSEELKDFNRVSKALGLDSTIENIDKVTAGLNSDQYVSWLDQHPSAKQALIKINELRDQLNSSKKL